MATPSTTDLTRQQLDELDALLQRMLASPLPSEPKPTEPNQFAPPQSLPESIPFPPSAPTPSFGQWRFDPPSAEARSYTPPLSPLSEMLTAGPRAEVFGSSMVERPTTLTRLPAPTPMPIRQPTPEPAPEPAPLPVPQPAPQMTLVEMKTVDRPSNLDGSPTSYLPPRMPQSQDVPVTPAVVFAPPAIVHEPRQTDTANLTPPMMPSPLTDTQPNLPSFGRIDLSESRVDSRSEHQSRTPNVTAPDIVIPQPPQIVVAEPTASTADSSVPLLLWPLHGVNWILESGLKTFGPLGEAITQPAMKYFLGISGIFLLVGAGAYTAYANGWLPIFSN